MKKFGLAPFTRGWMLIVAKVGILAFIAVAFFLYFTRLTSIHHVEPDAWLFNANGYMWSFRWNFDSVLRWSMGLGAAVLFLVAGIWGWLPIPGTGAGWRVAVLLVAAGLALEAYFELSFSWGFYLFSGAVCAFGMHRVHLQTAGWLQRNRLALARGFAWRSPVVLAFITSLFLGISIYAIHSGYPVLVDEQSQIAQARMMLSGRVNMAVSTEFLQYAVLPSYIPSSPTASQFPPGNILAQIPFLAVGLRANWVNVICGALSVYFTILFCRRLAHGRLSRSSMAGFIAGVLLMGSPQFIVIQSSGMNHGITMLMLIMAAWAFQECIRFGRWHLLWVGVFGLAWAGITRPYTAVPHGIVWGVALGWHGLYLKRTARISFGAVYRTKKQLLLIIGAGAVPLLILAAYNYFTTGHPLLFGYQKAQLHPVQFGFVNSSAENYAPAQALHNAVSDLMHLSRNMFGWLIPSWILIFGWLVFTRFSRMEVIVVALIVLQFVFYRLYFWYELILGSRYLSELMPFFAVLGGVGLSHLIQTMHPKWRTTILSVIVMFGVSAALESVFYWRERLRTFTEKHKVAAEFMKTVLPSDQPLVVTIPYEFNDVAADYAFRGVPVWFVYQKDEKAARRTPEFEGFRWIRFEGYGPGWVAER